MYRRLNLKMSSSIPGQNYIHFDDKQPFDPDVPPIKQKMRQVKLSYYSKPVYEFCKKYKEIHSGKHQWDQSNAIFDSKLMKGELDQTIFHININIFTWPNLMVAGKYIELHKKEYLLDPQSPGRRRPSKKRPTARRRRSSKARKARKSRTTRRK